MNVWGMVKNAFFVAGSLAGIAALARAVIESKHQEDMKRAGAILAKFNEGSVLELPAFTYNARRVPEWCLRPFDGVQHSIEDNQQEVRFIGPLRRALGHELEQMIRAYVEYRRFVQVPEWEPISDGFAAKEYDWVLQKKAFPKPEGTIAGAYDRHLDAATQAAELVKLRFQRFQALTELHFFEAIASKIFVPRKFRTANLLLPGEINQQHPSYRAK